MRVQPIVSVIIPVFNAERYLRECLDSIVNQTLKDIEIICIDDCSSDGSRIVLEEYEKADPRIHLICYSENKTASQARKDGVSLASGKYTMFVDADDRIELTTCQELSDAMEREQVDILQFGTYIHTVEGVPENRTRWFEEFVDPYLGFLQGKRVFTGCFRENLFGFSIWNKIYRTDLCKKAFSHVKDGRFPKAQDLYAFFLLSWFARTFQGIEKKYYHYNYGRGITGNILHMNLPSFLRHCDQSLVANQLKIFLDENDKEKEYNDIFETIQEKLLKETLVYWLNCLEETDGAKGYDTLCAQWGETLVRESIGKLFPTQLERAACRASGAMALLPMQKNGLPAINYFIGNLIDKNDNELFGGYEKIIPVVFATNENYTPYAGVAIKSLQVNADPRYFYRIYILHSNLSDHRTRALEKLSNTNSEVRCINVDSIIKHKIGTLYEKGYFSKEMYYRIILAEVLWMYDTAVYLDCDLVLISDISEIIPQSLGDALIAAIKNPCTVISGKHIKEKFNLSPETYINSGVLVINADAWRKERIADRCFRILEKTEKKELWCPDQDIINMACADRIYFLDPSWNYLWHFAVCGTEEQLGLYEETVKEFGRKARIIHYSSVIKPWNRPELPLADYFWEFARKTPFYEEILLKSVQQKIAERINESIEAKTRELIKENEQIQLDAAREREMAAIACKTEKEKNDALSEQLSMANEEIKKIHDSWTYRIGRFLTWPARKTRTFIRCLREHGVRYTVQVYFIRQRKKG